ncbi:MAG: hypothetical protein Q9182_002026 [Xanthomendoza sp. 2 TL-2023]
MPYATRFQGIKRPFLGERLEGDASTSPARGQKRKIIGPYVSPSPTPPTEPQDKKRKVSGPPSSPLPIPILTRRKTQPARAPSPPSNESNMTSSSSFPATDDDNDNQNNDNNDGDTNEVDMDSNNNQNTDNNNGDNANDVDMDNDDRDDDRPILDPDYSFDQPEGTGPGLQEESWEPNPIYEVRKINCRFRIPGTQLMQHRKDGETKIYGFPDDPIFNVKRINCRYRIPGTRLTEHWRDGKMSICAPGSKPWSTPLRVIPEESTGRVICLRGGDVGAKGRGRLVM